jgi:hypothetical protein
LTHEAALQDRLHARRRTARTVIGHTRWKASPTTKGSASFLRDQLLDQALYIRVAHDNRYLRAEMTEHTAAIRDVLERLAERGYVEPRPRWFADDGSVHTLTT